MEAPPARDAATESREVLEARLRREVGLRNKWNEEAEAIVQDFTAPLTADYCFDPAMVEFFGHTRARVQVLTEGIERIKQNGVTADDILQTRGRIEAANAMFAGKNEELKGFMSWLDDETRKLEGKVLPSLIAVLEREYDRNARLKNRQRQLVEDRDDKE